MSTAPYAARRLLVLFAGGSRRSPRSTPDQGAQALFVDTDNVVRTSAEELALARDESGDRAVETFTTAIDRARTALASSFEMRQRLDDESPETSAQRRDMLDEIIASCGRAGQELEAHADALIRLSGLATDFPAESLTTIANNVAMARERVVFAEQSLDKGRAIDAIRSAESAIEQAHTLLDSVDRAADDIRHAIATLPNAVTDLQNGIDMSRIPNSMRHSITLAKARPTPTRGRNGSSARSPLRSPRSPLHPTSCRPDAVL